jgi:LDH2 family malate/lactate/ureidoglycolate dehydrogenase
VLSGSNHTGNVEVGKRGQFFCFMDPDIVHPEGREAYYDAVEDFVAQVRAAETLPGEQVYLPGELEERQRQARLAAGVIRYPASVVDGLRDSAAKLGLPFDLVP